MKGKVDTLKAFDIEFKGLKEGTHTFIYSVRKEFFEQIENSLIDDGDIEAKVLLTKHSTYLHFEFDVNGSVVTICDRCLDPITIKLSNKGILYVKFGVELDDTNDEVLIIPHEEYCLNIAQYIYEFIALGLPMQIVHSNKSDDDKCNVTMLNKLKEFSSLSPENKSDEKETDPRWNELKKLIDKNK
ncbi:MAG: DUF177 domain-containing protein [Marinilabiliaceae bacterium]|nr:DUF177 domain-containing protein [Marinilabiliaceae bacterium]